MDRIEQILRERIDTEGEGEWSLQNTSVVVAVRARTSETFATAAEAAQSAIELVRALIEDSGYVVVNRANIGADCSPIGLPGGDGWHANLDVCFARADDLTAADHQAIPGLIA